MALGLQRKKIKNKKSRNLGCFEWQKLKLINFGRDNSKLGGICKFRKINKNVFLQIIKSEQ